jgi:peptidyl-prolyl cis-trans isomerase A (cyclophilin A)
MKSRFALLAVLAAVAVALPACRRAEPPAPTPTPTPVATPTPAVTPTPSAAPGAALRDPSRATEQAPERFRVRFDTTKGPFVVEVTRAWAPRGADRFYNLVKAGYYDDVAFFRVVSGFMVQFGIHGDPRVSALWREARIPDDPVSQSNTRGMLTYATAGPDTRTTQLFVNFKDNAFLDSQGFAPFGRVVEGMAVVDSLYAGYGEGAPGGMGPDQGRAQAEGNAYLRGSFPKLDFVKTARLAQP